MRRVWLLGAVALAVAGWLSVPLGASAIASATAGARQTPPLPTLNAPVNDFAHVIDADAAQEIDARIRALQAASGDAVVVATVPTLEPFGSIEEYAVKLFEQAKIGQRDKDNGVLLLVAVKEHKVRIEVGYGLEEFITDGFAGDTIRQMMLPEFRRNDYGAGLLAGTTAVINRIADARGVTLSTVPRAAPHSDVDGSGLSTIAPVVIFLLIFIVSRLRSGGVGPRGFGRGPWSGWGGGVGPFIGGLGGGFGGRSGGGFGGGFGGFGGGSSGGGGASGGW